MEWILDNKVLLLIIIIFILYRIFKTFGFEMLLKRGIRKQSGKFKIKDEKHSIIDSKHILVGAIYGQQQYAYANVLTTGIAQSEVKTVLEHYYGIAQVSDVEENLNYFLNEASNVYFKTVYQAFLKDTVEGQEMIINSATDDSSVAERAFSYLIHLEETFEEFKQRGFVQNKTDLEKITTLGWDMGRVVYVTRMCYDAGYISESNAKKYIDAAYVKSTEHFNTWKELAASYVLGRNMWIGNHKTNEHIYTVTQELLTDSNSPWLKISFK